MEALLAAALISIWIAVIDYFFYYLDARVVGSSSPTLLPLHCAFSGRSMMISVAMTLKKLADEHNLSVLVTNHMVAGKGAPKPALGESWKTVPHVRLVISHERGSNICAATVLKHTSLASGHVMKFAIPS